MRYLGLLVEITAHLVILSKAFHFYGVPFLLNHFEQFSKKTMSKIPTHRYSIRVDSYSMFAA